MSVAVVMRDENPTKLFEEAEYYAKQADALPFGDPAKSFMERQSNWCLNQAAYFERKANG